MTSPTFFNELDGELSGDDFFVEPDEEGDVGDVASDPSDAPLSVSDALQLAKVALESLRLRVVGEVSELSNKAGYKAVYFALSDGKGKLPCLMWRNRYDASDTTLQLGEQVELEGAFSVYPVRGDLQFYVDRIEPAGEGRLRAEVARRARALQAEGLMDAARKQALPAWPERIALVTSPQGAAVQDVLRTLARRWPVAHVLLCGVQVEGVGAPQSIVAGLQAADGAEADVVLLVRGGGSYENLLPFSEEAVARAVAAMQTPVVTGIGHEPDTSIADQVADLRASTPTAAAEAVSPDAAETGAHLAQSARRLATALSNRVARDAERLRNLQERPCLRDPQSLFAVQMQSVDRLTDRLERAIPLRLARADEALSQQHHALKRAGQRLLEGPGTQMRLLTARLDALSPLKVLSRGYAYATLPQTGTIVKSVAQVKPGDELALRLADGKLQTTITAKENGA
ncbi:MAG: exodeoxyribonuclease VII large subunit [Coriobacteriia bacterium]|nr:exodeoxyribonuclease VII large subunit [Coriobacteriia bacterium]